MATPDLVWSQSQRARWMRPDAERWQKPTLNRTHDVYDNEESSQASIDLKVLQLDTAHLRVAVADLRFALTLDRILHEQKYSASQPRVPAGLRRGGQWTAGGDDDDDDSEESEEGDDESGSDPFDSFAEATDAEASDADAGDAEDNDEDGFDLSDIFSALRGELQETFSFLDFLNGDERAQVQLVSDTNNPSGDPDPFPQIPQKEPQKSAERNAILRNVSNWLGRNAGIAGGIYRLSDQIEWIGNYSHLIEANRDPPRTLEELQQRAQSGPQRGYNGHHNVEQNAVKDGIPKSQIDDPSNLLLIPELKHYEITGYYNSKDRPLPDGTRGSPREYLRDKSFEVRRDFGLGVLRDKGVLK